MSTALEVIKTVLPFVGTALGGPLGTGIASVIASRLGVAPESVTDTLAALVNTPEGIVTAKQIETETKVHLAELGYQSLKDLAELEVRSVEAVNKTMQAESTAEHWMQYSWRPFNGFLFGITIFGTYFVLPLAGIDPPDIPEAVWIGWGGVLGIASFFRGKMQADPAIPPLTKIAPQPSLVSKLSQAIAPSTNPTIPAKDPEPVAPNAQNVQPIIVNSGE